MVLRYNTQHTCVPKGDSACPACQFYHLVSLRWDGYPSRPSTPKNIDLHHSTPGMIEAAPRKIAAPHPVILNERRRYRELKDPERAKRVPFQRLRANG
jgi:hypothetical protein